LFLTARLTRSPRTLFAAAAFGVLFYVMTPEGLSQRLGQVQSFTTSDRYYLSQIALRIAVDHPLLGVGWHAYEKTFMAYDYDHRFYKPKAPHSLFLAIAARSGFPALGVYLALFGITFAQLIRVENAYHRAGRSSDFGCYLAIALQAALVGHFVFGLAGSYGDSYYGFFVLALSFVLIRHHRRPEADFLP
jgi:O-antigen ligase